MRTGHRMMKLQGWLGLVLVAGLVACSADVPLEEPVAYEPDKSKRDYYTYGRMTGGDPKGFVLYSTADEAQATDGAGSGGGSGGGLGVNPFLWRASLETIDFLPLSQTDPAGGVIITDWYAPPETPNERFKLNVFVLDRSLRADGIKVTAFRQVRDANGTWSDAPVDPATANGIEESILLRARELRVASLEAAEG